jgi:NADH:ubiquinone oxidoreductase subunit 6 (subunit J)
MLGAIGVLVVSGVIMLYEVPKMKKSGMKKELILFFAILGFATTLSILRALGVDIPNPLEGMKTLLEPIGMSIQRLFGSGGEG